MMAMDAMERQLAHEAYQPPVVGVEDVVLFKRKGRNVWSMGMVYPPQKMDWQPGMPVGKRISILAIEIGMAPKIVQDCYHINDPKFVYDPGFNGSICCWKEMAATTTSDFLATYNELLGKTGQLEAEMSELKKNHQMLLGEMSRLSARLEAPKQTLKKNTPALTPDNKDAA